jgi:hypothetical protein
MITAAFRGWLVAGTWAQLGAGRIEYPDAAQALI